jgi:hypothetical protein
MQIQVNRENSAAVVVTLSAFVEAEANVNGALAQFADEIGRVAVHLSDLNVETSGNQDKRSLMEAQATGRNPGVVTGEAAAVDMAVLGATQKVDCLRSSRFGRLEAKR